MEVIYNWGIYPKVNAKVISCNNADEAKALIKNESVIIARGNGRCYGDSSLQKTVFSTLALNKILEFDAVGGVLKCEAGVSLDDILKVVVPKGFFLPVSPGTKFITIGGAVASNIHGKNHHKEGAISKYVVSLDLLTESGEVVTCSLHHNTELFKNTIGGMGLTGIVLTVTIKLKKVETSFIKQKSIKARNLEEILRYFNEYKSYTYSVAWIDCMAKGESLGRSVLLLGEHALVAELNKKQKQNALLVHSSNQLNVPFMFPTFTLNQLSVKLFNELYYNKQLAMVKESVIHYNPYFYPLDVIRNWNRIYGKNGFTQYQFVLPFEKGVEGLEKILSKIAHSGCASFLAVLKTFGESDGSSSPISFPAPGFTLALDFKITDAVFNLLDALDEIVIEYKGRLYLSKDSRMSRATFHKTYSAHLIHPDKFNSLQSERLSI